MHNVPRSIREHNRKKSFPNVQCHGFIQLGSCLPRRRVLEIILA
jgi:hypothetical protein